MINWFNGLKLAWRLCVAGATLVIIRNDLLENINENIPSMMNYKIQDFLFVFDHIYGHLTTNSSLPLSLHLIIR